MRPPPKKPNAALPVPKQLKVHHPENEPLSRFFLEKWRAMMQEPDGLSQNNYLAFANANRSLCSSKEPIRTLKGFSNVKGVGTWLINHMKSFFEKSSQDLSPAKGKKAKGTKSYLPRKNTAAYAILITLHRAKASGKDFMMKQELIDAAEASGLSRDAIGPNKSKAKQSYGKDWYTGWSCMKTLLSNRLVTKWSNPAKYMLTQEGEGTARDCLSRSGLDDSARPLTIIGAHNTSAMNPSVARPKPELVSDSSLTKKKSNCYHQVQTTGKPECKKLRYDPPEYLDELEEIFHDILVDGPTSYIAGQENFDEEGAPEDAEDVELEEEEPQGMDQSPTNSNSHKRSGSTGTRSTATSPGRLSKSPMVKMMRELVTKWFSAEENLKVLEEAIKEKKQKRNKLSESVKKYQDLALECGAAPDSVEYYACAKIFRDEFNREFFCNIPNPEARLVFLKRWCQSNNMY